MSRYDDLFKDYVAELRQVREFALTWWDGLLAAAMAGGVDAAGAEAVVRPRWPAGPVSHPRVIAVYRKYHLLVARINQPLLDRFDEDDDAPDEDREVDWGEGEEEPEGVSEPYYILIEKVYLMDKGLGEFIAGLAFVPAGTDEDGNDA
jgi:hypothetical protein